MRTRAWITASLLTLLLAAVAAGLFLTRDRGDTAPKARTPRERKVDETPLLTARRLAPLAETAEEQGFARQAVRLANHAVDLAFAEALRQAVEEAPPLPPEAKALLAEKAKNEGEIAEDQQRIKALTEQMAVASGRARADLEARLEVARAQLELDQDEREEAAEKLERAGGDPQARIRRLKAAHEATDRETSPEVPKLAPGNHLIARFRAWHRPWTKRRQLARAQQDALARVERLAKRQEAMAQSLKTTREERSAAKELARGVARTEGAGSQDSRNALAALHRFTQDQRRLTNLVQRSQDQRGLADVYAAWGAVASTAERAALHQLLMGVLYILLVAGGALLLGHEIQAHFRKRAQEDPRSGTHGSVIAFAVQAAAALAVIFLVVGMPGETTTILGLAGAGLTVALKDFIVAFLGWFVLMGRNGIRVGDWVEIKGVSGEVVEIGPLRTVLLETGDGSSSGHPTGRRVAFVNGFAMEGHFFNFTTSGQWMWDELQVHVPAGADPRPILEGVQALVEARTQANVAQAEKEWQGATSRYRVKAFSVLPGLQVLPGPDGLDIHARYITRAFERHETRKELNLAVMELVHGG